MRQRPRILILLSWALVALAVCMPLQVMMLYGHNTSEVGAIFAKLTYINWTVMIAAMACSLLVFQASPYLRYAIPALIGLISVNNFFVAYYATDYSPWVAVVATVAVFGLRYPLSRPDVRLLLHNPDHRWWMAAQRKRVRIPIFLAGRRNGKLRTETYDISETGAFIPLRSKDELADLAVSEGVNVCLTIGTFTQLRCEGQVARVTVFSGGQYPAGVGIKFVNMPWHQRRELRRYLARAASA